MCDTDVEIGHISVTLSFCSAFLGTTSFHTSRYIWFFKITLLSTWGNFLLVNQLFIPGPSNRAKTSTEKKICELGWISTETSISPPSQRRNLTHSFISVVTKPGSSSYKRAHALTACSWTDQVAHLWLTDLPRRAARSVLSESKLKVHSPNAIEELFTKGLAEKIQKIWEHAQIF